MTLIPAYGRDYSSKTKVREAWKMGRDFLVYAPGQRIHLFPVNRWSAGKRGLSSLTVIYRGGQRCVEVRA